MFLRLTFRQLQVEGVPCLLHVVARPQAFHLVSQLLQLDVKMYFILCSRKLSASRAGRWHQVAHLEKVGEDLRYSVLSAMFLDSSGPVSTHRLSLWDSVGLQTKLQILRLHTKRFFAEDFINAWKHKHKHVVVIIITDGGEKWWILPFPLKAAINGLYFCSLSSNCRPPSRISLLRRTKAENLISVSDG